MNGLELLKYIIKLLEKNKIMYCFESGSLLKAYRDNKLDEKDDIDFIIFKEDWEKFNKIIEELILYNTKFFYKVKWKKEISLKYTNEFQIDFQLAEYDEKNLYIYAYRPNPYDNYKWSYEWRLKFPKDYYLPLKKRNFFDLNISIPNKIEKKLELHYGSNWRKPIKEDWSYAKCPKDFNYPSIGIVSTTFLRDDMVIKWLEYYRKLPYRIYLGDNGYQSNIKDDLYNKLNKEGHCIKYLPFDCGLSYARNTMIQNVKEDFVFLTDDDIFLITNLDEILPIFAVDNKLGVIGGRLNNKVSNIEQKYTSKLEIKDGSLNYYKQIKTGEYYTDIVLNFALYRREVFNKIKYDNELKLGEHSSYFIRLKYESDWKVYYNEKLIGDHYVARSDKYWKFRARDYTHFFKEKWKINNIEWKEEI